MGNINTPASGFFSPLPNVLTAVVMPADAHIIVAANNLGRFIIPTNEILEGTS